MDTNQVLNLSSSDLRRAAAIQERIEELKSELSTLLGGSGSTVRRGRPPGGKRTMSAAGRARIAAAARARWAREKGETPKSGNNTEPGKKRRTMSVAARKKIAAAARARWAKVRAAKGTA